MFVFCTVYRVGNLDEPNHTSIINTIKTFYTVRNPRKIFILGDFNLRCISWPLSDENELSSNMKMRENLYSEDDPDLITNKFWSHIKSNYKSCRLPATMHLNSTFRNKPSEKPAIFNNYFYDQFSGPSD